MGRKSYLLISSEDRKLIAMGEVMEIRPDMTFRFWKRKSVYFHEEENVQKNFGRNYNVGTVIVQYIAVGETNFDPV